MQSTGTFFAAARLAGATSPPAHVLTRSIGLQVQIVQKNSILIVPVSENWLIFCTVKYHLIMSHFQLQGLGQLLDGIFGAAVGTAATV